MTLYRYNLRLAQELLTIVSCFEVSLRNRIAHHEPLCFPTGQAAIDTTYIRREYQKILTLFQWMGIDGRSMLYGLDHVQKVCDNIDQLRYEPEIPGPGQE